MNSEILEKSEKELDEELNLKMKQIKKEKTFVDKVLSRIAAKDSMLTKKLAELTVELNNEKLLPGRNRYENEVVLLRNLLTTARNDLVLRLKESSREFKTKIILYKLCSKFINEQNTQQSERMTRLVRFEKYTAIGYLDELVNLNKTTLNSILKTCNSFYTVYININVLSCNMQWYIKGLKGPNLYDEYNLYEKDDESSFTDDGISNLHRLSD